MTTTEFIAAHADADIRALALQGARYAGVDLPFALDQIAGRQTARHKLPAWARTEGIVYPPRLAMEQCSSEAAARYKAQVAARHLTGGGGFLAADNRGLQLAVADNGCPLKSKQLQDSAPSLPTAATATASCSPQLSNAGKNACPPSYGGKKAAATGQAAPTPYSLLSTPHTLTDLTGGFGVDFSFLAPLAAAATYVERQAGLCRVAQDNFRALGLTHARVVQADAEAYAAQMPAQTLVYADPARRDTHGARTYAIADCTPDLHRLLPLLATKAQVVMVKLSPMIDFHRLADELAVPPLAVAEIHIVAVDGECKELLVVMRGEAPAAPALICADIDSRTGRTRTEKFAPAAAAAPASYCDCKSQPPVTAPASHCDCKSQSPAAAPAPTLYSLPSTPSYLYDPSAAIMKAGAWGQLSRRYGVRMLAPNSHLFFADAPVPGFPGRAFRVRRVVGGAGGAGVPSRKAQLKALRQECAAANVATRNYPLAAEALRRKLGLKDGGANYLFATTGADGQHLLILCEKIASNYEEKQ